MGPALTKKEVQNIKFLLSKGMDIEDISTVTARSRHTIVRVQNGERDYLLGVEISNELAKAYNLIWNALVILEKLGGNSNEKINQIN